MSPPKASATAPLRTTSYSYDGAGNLKTIEDPSNRTTTIGYDAADQRTSVAYSDGVTPNVTNITYDDDGQRTAMTDGSGTSGFVWDSLHRLTSPTDGAGHQVAYGYDLNSQLTSITYPGVGDLTVTRTFDDAGRLRKVKDWLQHETSFNYDNDNTLADISYPGSVLDTYGSDTADRLMSITSEKSASTLASFTYTRDNANLIKTLTPTGVTQSNETYGYSNLNQVTSVNTNNYAYDAADNLTQMDPKQLAYDKANELQNMSSPITKVAATGATSPGTNAQQVGFAGVQANDQILVAVTGTTSQTMTANGYTSMGSWDNASGVRVTLLRRTALGGEPNVTVNYSPVTAAHSYAVEVAIYRGVDPVNPLDGTPSAGFSGSVNVTAPSITTSQAGDRLLMLQGAAGNAVAQTWTPPAGMTEQTQHSTTLVAGGIADQDLATAGATGDRTSTLSASGATTTLAGVLVALKQPPPAIMYLHQDQLGSTRFLTDGAGDLAATYTFDAYGNMTAKTGTAGTPLQFAGEYADGETGFQYLRARYYDPATGQFINRDPIEQLTQQPYTYAGNNPLNMSDPTGLFGWGSILKVAVAVVAVAAVAGAVACTLSVACGVAVASTLGVAGFGAAAGETTAVIGESMDRVVPYAEQMGADYFSTEATSYEAMMAENQQWINDAMDQGCHIRDIGAAAGRANFPEPTSPFYQMERDEIMRRGYTNYSQDFGNP